MSENTPRNRRASGLPHVWTVLCFALAVGIGSTQGPQDAFANAASAPSDDTRVELAAVSELESRLAALSEEVSGDLAARVEAKTETIADRATQQQTAALLELNRSISTFVIWAGVEVQARKVSRTPPASVP